MLRGVRGVREASRGLRCAAAAVVDGANWDGAAAGRWLAAGLGLAGIASIMLQAAARLDAQQAERRTGDAAYAAYVDATPRLWPRL